MRVFVTGATGFIGSAVIRELLSAGHMVLGLARTEAAAKSLAAIGAEAHRGTLHDLAGLAAGAAKADGVIHLAFMHGPSKASLPDLARIFLGGLPGGIVGRFLKTAADADREAIGALAAALKGSNRPLLTTFGTLGAASRQTITEDAEPDPNALAFVRAGAERIVRASAAQGVRAIVMRLPPTVHGDGDTGFMPRLIVSARKARVSPFVGDGANRWPAVHRLDAARLFRLALEKGEAGARYHAVAEEGVAFREIAETIGRRLGVPAVSQNAEEAAKHFSFLAAFAATDNPTSSRATREKLDWTPKEVGLLEDLERGRYF